MDTPRTQVPTLDAFPITPLVGGAALIGAGVALILQVPEARETCGRILRHPEVKRVGRNAAQAIVREVAASLGWEIRPGAGAAVAN